MENSMKNIMKKSIVKNLSFAFLAQSASLLLNVIMSLIVPKILDPSQYGYWQLFIFYSNYVGFFHFGLNDGIYLKLGGENYSEVNKKILKSQLVFSIITQSIMAVIISISAVSLCSESERMFILIISSIFMVINNATLYIGYVFQATNITRLYSISVIIEKVIILLSVLIFIIFNKTTFYLYVAIYLLAKVISFLYCAIKAWDIITAKSLSIRLTIIEAFDNIKVGLPLMLSNIASSLILGNGRYFIERKWGIVTFGKVSFALSMTNFFLMFIYQIGMVIFPILRNLEKSKLKNFYKLALSILDLFFPLILVLFVPVKLLCSMWLPQYKESLYYLALLMPVCLFDGKIQMLYNPMFKSLRKERLLLKLNVVTTILSLTINFVGITIFNSLEIVIIGMTISIIFRSVLAELYMARYLNIGFKLEDLYIIAYSLIFMRVSNNFSDIAIILILILVYLIYLVCNKRKISSFRKLYNNL